MALLRYIQVMQHRRPGSLPDTSGPLSALLPSSAIEEANAAVNSVRQEESVKSMLKCSDSRSYSLLTL